MKKIIENINKIREIYQMYRIEEKKENLDI